MTLFVATVTGKMLCGWQDPQQKVAAPRLDVIVTQTNAGLIGNYIKSLFSSVGIAALDGHLKPFCDYKSEIFSP